MTWYAQDLKLAHDATAKAQAIVYRVVDQQGEHLSQKGKNIVALLDVVRDLLNDYDAEWESHDKEHPDVDD